MAAGLFILFAGAGGDLVYRGRQNARMKCRQQGGEFNPTQSKAEKNTGRACWTHRAEAGIGLSGS